MDFLDISPELNVNVFNLFLKSMQSIPYNIFKFKIASNWILNLLFLKMLADKTEI